MLTLVVVVRCGAASHEQDVVRFDLDSRGGITVPVFVNGRGPFQFLLDTGSSSSSITESFAARIGAVRVAKSEILTAAGRTLRAVVELSRVSVGSAAVDCLLPSVLPDNDVKALAAHLDGILGQDFLAPHNYTLDYRGRTLNWRVNADDKSATRLALVKHDAQLLVELPQDGGRVVRLVPDSGAEGLVLFVRHGRTPVDVDGVVDTVHLNSIAGGLQVRAVSVRTLKVGMVTLRNEPGVILEVGNTPSQEGDGLLPLHRFRKVTFNAAGYVVVQH
jgi:hypothetical protein